MFVMHSHTTNVIYPYLKTSVLFRATAGVRTVDLLGLYMVANVVAETYSRVAASLDLFHTFISERDYTQLECFYQGCTQSNQQVALRRLMHSIHCGSAIFPYQALERRPAQETLMGCEGLRNNFEGIGTFLLLCSKIVLFQPAHGGSLAH
jgi:hypothetical protein